MQHRLVPVLGALVLLFAGQVPVLAQASSAGGTPEEDSTSCQVIGRVIDAATGDPVTNASVWLESADGRGPVAATGTTADGNFLLEVAECETGPLRVEMLGYVDATESISFDEAGQTHQVTIRLERDPIEVEALTVEIPKSLRLRDVGFYARRAWEESTGKDLGQFYDPEEVEARGAAGGSVLAIGASARIRWVYGGCSPSYYLDGTRLWDKFGRARSSPAMRMLEYGLKPSNVEGIEIYRSTWGAVPEEFRDPVSNTCGAIVIWTKHGGPGYAPPIEVALCKPSDDEGVSLGGVVTDEITGVPLPASYVTLSIPGRNGGAIRQVQTVADEAGVYRYCDLDEWPTAVQARYGSVVAEAFAIPDRAAPGYWAVDLKVAVANAGVLAGVVAGDVDPTETQVMLKGIETTLQPTERGYFEFPELEPGSYVLIVRRGEEELIRRRVTIRSGLRELVTLDIGQER